MQTHIAFVDLKKAFDRVSCKQLLRIVACDEVPQQTIQNIYNLYNTNLISVQIEDRSIGERSIQGLNRDVASRPSYLLFTRMPS
jgi:hypothetical protein